MSAPAAPNEPLDGRWAEILSGRYGIYTFLLNLGITLFGINQFVVATVMPTVVASLGGVGYYTWVFSLFAVGSIIGAAGAGPMRDAVGIRIAYVGAGVLLGIGLAGSALATGMPALVGWRLVQGIGGGAIASLAYGLVASVYPPRLRSRILSLVSTIWGIATLGGPAIGALFATPTTWRGAFWSLTALTAVFIVLAWRTVEGERGHGDLSRMPFDRLALLALAVLSMSATSLTMRTPIQAMLTFAAILAAGLAFVRDARAERSIFPRQASMIGTEIGATYWVFFLMSVVLAFINTYTTFLLQTLHAIPPFVAGYLFCIQSFMWTVSALFVADIRPAHYPLAIIVGLALVVISAATIAVVVTTGPVVLIAAALLVSGVGMGIVNNPAIQHIILIAPPGEGNIAGASVQAVRNIGISFGAAAAGMVAATAGLVDRAPLATVAYAMTWVFAVNVVISLAALAVGTTMLVRFHGPRLFAAAERRGFRLSPRQRG